MTNRIQIFECSRTFRKFTTFPIQPSKIPYNLRRKNPNRFIASKIDFTGFSGFIFLECFLPVCCLFWKYLVVFIWSPSPHKCLRPVKGVDIPFLARVSASLFSSSVVWYRLEGYLGVFSQVISQRTIRKIFPVFQNVNITERRTSFTLLCRCRNRETTQ